MIRSLAIAFLLAFTAAAAHGQAIDQGRLAEALAQKETGGIWDGRPGPAGELSRYQITERVWRQHSAEPFAQARVEAKARAVALAHLDWLAVQIRASGQAVTVERLATCWHFGWTHARRRSVWGTEVENLYGAP